MNKTKIEWVKNPDGTQGFTSNPFTGCLNGCPYCYARQESYGRCKQADLKGYPLESGHDDNPFYPRYHPERLLDIVARKKPAGIFLNDRSDGFADYWPKNYQEDIWETIELCPQHRFYLLTKQPQNLIKFSPFPDNCWVGVTATNAGMWATALMNLSYVEAKVKYISIEPYLGMIIGSELDLMLMKNAGLDWVIIGACTGSYIEMVNLSRKTRQEQDFDSIRRFGNKRTLQPKIEWVEEIVRAADKAGVPVFLKNNLYPLLGLGDGKSICHNNEVGTLRQEMPTTNV